jgi:hypothetical protein
MVVIAFVLKDHAMKMYIGMEVKLHIFLTLALDGNEWPASCSGHFILGRLAPIIQRIRFGHPPEPV